CSRSSSSSRRWRSCEALPSQRTRLAVPSTHATTKASLCHRPRAHKLSSCHRLPRLRFRPAWWRIRPQTTDATPRRTPYEEDERKIVVIGGTGLIGSKLVARLRQHGHDTLAASPDTGVDTLTGAGLADALEDAEVVVDVANAPAWDDAAVMEFFKTS